MFIADTPITMANGTTRIVQALKRGDSVRAIDGQPDTVVRMEYFTGRPAFRIGLENGVVLRGGSSLLELVKPNGGYVSLIDLLVGDQVCAYDASYGAVGVAVSSKTLINGGQVLFRPITARTKTMIADNVVARIIPFAIGVTFIPGFTPTSNCLSLSGTQFTAITPGTLIASGGVAPYTFSASGLPTGLTCSVDGTISGTPMVYGTYPYTVTITDAIGDEATISCSITVAQGLIFEDLFQRGPASDWGSRWGNPASAGVWTIDNNNPDRAIITCEPTLNNHYGNPVQKADLTGALDIASSNPAFYVEGSFNNTTISFFGMGAIYISAGATFGIEFGVQKAGGTNSIYTSHAWATGGSGLPTNFSNKVLKLAINTAGTVITAYIDGVSVGTFDSSALSAPYNFGMAFKNLGAGNSMVTLWDYFRCGYV